MLHQVSLTSDFSQQLSLSCLIKKTLFKSSCTKIMRIFIGSTGTSVPFCPLLSHIAVPKKSPLYFKTLALNDASSRRTVSHADAEYQRTNDFQVLPLSVKNSTPRRAFCQTSTQQLGLSTKGAPLCCWGYRWQVPLRCGCLKIKRSSVVCRGPSVSIIASSRQLSGKLEGPN